MKAHKNILTSAILFLYKKYSFVDTLKVIQKFAPQRLINGLSEHGDEKVRLYINNFVGMSDNTLSGIYSELSKNVVPLVTDDEVVSALSRKNVVTPEDLEYGYDVFIKIPEHLLRQWKSLLTLIVNQFLTFFERRDENNDRPILFLLDEFPRLGKIPAIIDGLATLRSRKITIALIVQSLAQLDHIYGHNARKVIADTCAYKAILGATDAETQEYFSRLFGTYDKTITSYGTQNEYFTGFPRGSSTSTYEQERRIIKPEEFGHMNNIALLSPFGFSIIDKAPYYGG